MASFRDEIASRRSGNRRRPARSICALSGGVDSSVTAILLREALGGRVHPILVDHGLMRAHERRQVEEAFGRLGIPIRAVDASDLFLSRLAGVTDPEEKRRIIGRTFIEVFEREAKTIPGARYLAQGTLYPDVIESVSIKGPSAVIKTHHNVGGLPEKLGPRADRAGARALQGRGPAARSRARPAARVPERAIRFPARASPCGFRARSRAKRLRSSRRPTRSCSRRSARPGSTTRSHRRSPCFFPVKTVGVMGDMRTHEFVLAVRAVQTMDFMTADWFRMPHEVLDAIATRVVRTVRGINRVVYDVTSKPPATIEWE